MPTSTGLLLMKTWIDWPFCTFTNFIISWTFMNFYELYFKIFELHNYAQNVLSTWRRPLHHLCSAGTPKGTLSRLMLCIRRLRCNCRCIGYRRSFLIINSSRMATWFRWSLQCLYQRVFCCRSTRRREDCAFTWLGTASNEWIRQMSLYVTAHWSVS